MTISDVLDRLALLIVSTLIVMATMLLLSIAAHLAKTYPTGVLISGGAAVCVWAVRRVLMKSAAKRNSC